MEKYIVRKEANPNPIPRRRQCGGRWKRSDIQVNGRIESKYRRQLCGLLLHSYAEVPSFISPLFLSFFLSVSPVSQSVSQSVNSIEFMSCEYVMLVLLHLTNLSSTQIGAFPHLYLLQGAPCPTHVCPSPSPPLFSCFPSLFYSSLFIFLFLLLLCRGLVFFLLLALTLTLLFPGLLFYVLLLPPPISFPSLFSLSIFCFLFSFLLLVSSSFCCFPSFLYFLSSSHGVSALQFDAKGIYLASVTKSGCLMVHDFESLYCQTNVTSPWVNEDEAKHLLHISTFRQLDSVQWNPSNQDEVACTSMKSSEIFIYDIGYVSSKPVEVLRKKPSLTIHGVDIRKGLSDVAFTSSNDSRIFASDTYGSINIWDRRRSAFPSVELTTNSHNALHSIELNMEDQIVYGAGNQGIIYIWDLRGGRSSAAFQSHKEAYHPPLASVKLSTLLEKVESLKAQSAIVPKDVHSISLDPSCAYSLAFHLEDGWSGILDVRSLEVSHIHCPPPAWLDASLMSSNFSYLRKPSWLSTNSIYVVGSSTDKGLHLLDFYPDPSSPCHVDFSEDMLKNSRQNGFVPLSEDVTACAAHPCNSFVVAGTKQASLLVVSQRKKVWQGEEDLGNSDKILEE